MRTARSLLAAAALLALPALSPAQDGHPVLLKDLNRNPFGPVPIDPGSSPRPLGVAGDRLLFSAHTQSTGREPWITKGTPATTRMLADVVPGIASSDPQPGAVTGDGTYVLPMTHPTFGPELFRVTPADRVELVADQNPGLEGLRFSNLVSAPDGLVYFVTLRPIPGDRYEVALRSTDGKSVRTIQTIGNAPLHEPQIAVKPGTSFAPVFLTFAADDGTHGKEPWISDGTTQGTKLKQDLVPGAKGSDPDDLVFAPDGFLYAAADVPGKGRELIRFSDVGVIVDHELTIGPGGSDIRELVVHQGDLFAAADDRKSGNEPWQFTTATQQWKLVADVNPGPAGSNPSWLTSQGTRLAFAADDGSSGRELYLSGASGVTRFDVNPGPTGSDPRFLIALPNGLAFVAGAPAVQLHHVDATGNLKALTTTTGGAQPQDPVRLGNTLLASANVGQIEQELFGIDVQTLGAPVLVANANPQVQRTAFSIETEGGFHTFGFETYFLANDGSGPEIWRTEGSHGRTVKVSSAWPLIHIQQILAAAEDSLLLLASNVSTGLEIFTLDPRTGTVALLKDINPGAAASLFPFRGVRLLNGPFAVRASARPVFFFPANDGQTFQSLWRTDGTPSGTIRLQPSTVFGGAGSFTQFHDGIVVFGARSTQHGHELWRTDGSAAGTGTQPIVDIHPGPASGFGGSIILWENLAYFAGTTAIHGTELWVTGGTFATTSLVADILPGVLGSGPSDFVVSEAWNVLLFAAKDANSGRELFSTNGTAAGTQLVRDLAPGPQDSSPRELTVVGRELYLTAESPQHGRRVLWYDPLGLGSALIPIQGKFTSGELRKPALDPANLTVSGDWLYFTANPGSSGIEYWIAKDYELEQLRDVPRQAFGSGYRLPIIAPTPNGTFFALNDYVTGDEPHVARGSANLHPVGTPANAQGGGGIRVTRYQYGRPTLGDPLTIRGNSLPSAPGALMLSGIPQQTTYLAGVPFRVDFATLLTAPFSTDPQGAFSAGLTVPDVSDLIGLRARIQLLTVNVPTFSFELSQGFDAVVDRR